MSRTVQRRGFTLIELVIALAILAVLVTMAAPVVKVQIQRQKETELRIALREIRSALDAYKRAGDDGLIARRADASGYPPRLEELVVGLPNLKDPQSRRIYFLRRIPRDPMHPDPATPAAQTWALRSYASPPEAPAEGADVFDVYSRSERTALDGTRYRDW